MKSRFSLCLLLTGLLIPQSCAKKISEEGWLPTYETAGQVTVNGVPAKGAIVRFYPVSPQADANSPVVPAGVVQEDGTFQLTSYKSNDGAPEGEYHVTLIWPDPKLLSPQLSTSEDPPDRLKNRFAKPERSTIKVRIAAGENHLEPIVLEKVEILSGSSLQ